MGHKLEHRLKSYDCQATEGDVEICLWLMRPSGRLFSNGLESHNQIITLTKDSLLSLTDQPRITLQKLSLVTIEAGRYR